MPICPFIGLSVYRRRPVPICPFIGLSVYRRRPRDLSVYRFIGLSAQAGKNRPCHHAVGLDLNKCVQKFDVLKQSWCEKKCAAVVGFSM